MNEVKPIVVGTPSMLKQSYLVRSPVSKLRRQDVP